MEDVHNLINFGPTNPIQILNQHEFFLRFCMCPSNDTCDKNKKSWSSNSKDRKSTRDKATISNPKVNRGCAPFTANRTSADCVQISLEPSIPYIPLGVYRTGRNLCKVYIRHEACIVIWFLVVHFMEPAYIQCSNLYHKVGIFSCNVHCNAYYLLP